MKKIKMGVQPVPEDYRIFNRPSNTRPISEFFDRPIKYHYHELWRFPKDGKPEMLREYTGDKGLESAKSALLTAELLDKNSRYKIMSWQVKQRINQ